METHFFCGHCYQCRIGNAHNCLNMGLLGLTWDGVFAEYAKVPANVCFPLPASVPMEIGALFEPAGVSVHALQRMGNVASNSALVCGAGPIGLMVIQLLMLYGASKVVALDLNPARRKFAEGLGAIAVDPGQVDVADFCRKEFSRSGGVDMAFETSGASTVLTTLFESVRREGRDCHGGPSRQGGADRHSCVYQQEGHQPERHFRPAGVGYLGDASRPGGLGRLDLSWLITHRLPFEEFEHGLELLSKDAAKVILHP